MKNFAIKKLFFFDVIFALISIFIYYFLWGKVYKNYSTIGGYTQIQMTVYIIFARILSLQFSGGINQIVSDWIYEGKIGVELLRPITMIGNLFYRKIGEFVSFIVLKAIPICLVTLFILDLDIREIQNIYNFIFFSISLELSVVVLFEIEFIVGILSIFTLYDYGLRTAKTALISILSGAIIPINILPQYLRKIVDILLGVYSIEKNIDKLFEQVGWIILLGIIMWYGWNKFRKYIIVQGG